MVEYNSILLNDNGPKTQRQFLWHLAKVADLQKQHPTKRLLAKYLNTSNYVPETTKELYQITSVLLSHLTQ